MPRPCPTCKATGEVACPHCQGSKMREHPTGNSTVRCHDCDPHGKVECPDCEGLKELD